MIEKSYLLPMTLACYVDEHGVRSAEELWQKDLIEHLSQIRHLTLAAPLRREPPPAKVLPIDTAGYPGELTYLDLPPCRSTLSTLLALPTIAARLWKAVGRAEIVQGSAGGWPISFSWLAIPMAKLRGKFTLTNVESAGWRLGFRWPWRPKPLLQAIAFESMARFMVNVSDVATFTHSGYRDSMLLASRKSRGHVVCASWLDAENLTPPEEARALWDAKLADPSRPLRLVFAASLLPAKGVRVLLDAARELNRRGLPLVIDVYGKGPLLDECAAASAELRGSVELNLKGTLAYGPPFFRMLRDYDLMAIPSLSDEQPRIIYDAFSQALPVIGSDTAGVLECVTHDQDGRIVPAGDPGALADGIAWASAHRDRLREFGINSLEVAHSLTHEQMHARRAAIIEAALAPRAVGIA